MTKEKKEKKGKKKKKTYYYAVVSGSNPGVYKNHEDAQRQLVGLPNASLQKFRKKKSARKFFKASRTSSSKKSMKPTSSSPSRSPETKTKLAEKPPVSPLLDDDAVRTKYNISPQAKLIYTDGSSLNQDPNSISAGAGVFFAKDDPRNISTRVPEVDQSRGCAELFAVFKGLETVYLNRSELEEREIIVLSDYQSGVDELSKRLRGDESKRCRRYKELFEDILAWVEGLGVREQVEVTFKYVPGHRGILGNMAADRPAREGAKKITE